MAYKAIEDLVFAVEAWTRDGQHVEEVIARAGNLGIARAAFDAACLARPDRPLTLRHRARVIASQGLDEGGTISRRP